MVRSKWRLSGLAIIAIAATFLGFYWYDNPSDNTVERTSASSSPLSFSVYTATPSTSVSVNIQIRKDQKGNNFAYLYVNAAADTDVLLISSEIDTPSWPVMRPLLAPRGDISDVGENRYSFVIPRRNWDLQWDWIAKFKLPEDAIIDGGDGSLHAVLPAVALGENGQQREPYMGMAEKILTSHIVPKEDQRTGLLNAPRSPTAWESGYGEIKELFWEPDRLDVTEQLLGAAAEMTKKNIHVNLPSNGTVHGLNFMWRGSYGISPMLITRSKQTDDLRHRHEFYAGIAIASGFAAGVAALQELPDAWRRKRRQEVNKTDQVPDPELREESSGLATTHSEGSPSYGSDGPPRERPRRPVARSVAIGLLAGILLGLRWRK